MSTTIQPSLFERPNTELPDIESGELLTALRRNMSLLSELAIRYDVETRPERDPERPALTNGQAVYDLLAPGWRRSRRNKSASCCWTGRCG